MTIEWSPLIASVPTDGGEFTLLQRTLKKAGRDFLLDAYLLSFCAQHLGNHGSHVSFMVQVLLRENGKPYDNFEHVNPTLVARLHRVFSFVIPFHARKILRPMVPAGLRRLMKGTIR